MVASFCRSQPSEMEIDDEGAYLGLAPEVYWTDQPVYP